MVMREHRLYRLNMSRLADSLERIATTIENARSLDPVAAVGQKVAGAVPPGRLKDLLSGSDLGHPVHPILVTLPIGAFTSALAFDLIGDRAAARRLIALGLLTSLPAAATGASDWADTTEAERRVGLTHAALNTLALSAFGTSWVLRRSPGRGKVSALVGLGILGASGWLGGHLAYAMGVGVDTTVFSQAPADWTDVCEVAELVGGQPRAFDVNGLSVLLVSRDGRIDAILNRCTHRGAPLDEGQVVGDCIECPWHGSRFRLEDGMVERGPATRPQPVLKTRVAGTRVQVCRSEPRALRRNPA
jgi:nitrite reductase/ring-hydroxylating ferredoxin subunit/uncharacterized membrane protein